ncbi:hypothetical protein MCUN1_003332 [Malassezia cuniculi]|uniref:Uncharacterized protein n=1 Tax=Malassezia cuniculi TaxID=948313 RepID=A0AAF0ESX4_9BASI|nr:hypothetical protein MCUN1_003332 [Malassezia cuniculi]
MPGDGASRERAFLFHPPALFRDELNIIYTHAHAYLPRRTFVSDPPDPSSVNTADARNQRRLHVRRLFDLVHLCILRGDRRRAARALQLLMHTYEWRPSELWHLGLVVAGMPGDKDYSARYLGQMSLRHPELRSVLMPHLAYALIKEERYAEARDEIEKYVFYKKLTSVISTRPHRYNPQLHVYLALLILHGSVGPTESEEPLGFLSAVPSAAIRAAEQHFTNAVQLAARFKSIHQMNLRTRVRNSHRRARRELERNHTHQQTTMKRMQKDAWALQESESEQDAPAAQAAGAPSSSSESSSDSDEEIDIETALEAGFGTDHDDSSEDDAPVHGPAPAPASHAAPHATVHEPAQANAEANAEANAANSQADVPDADEVTFLFPANDWAVTVAKIYLDALQQLGGTKRPKARK